MKDINSDRVGDGQKELEFLQENVHAEHPDPPEWLDEDQQKFWRILVKSKAPADWLCPTSLLQLSQLCVLSARFFNIQQEIDENNLFQDVNTRSGWWEKPDPRLAIQSKVLTQMRGVIRDLGLNSGATTMSAQRRLARLEKAMKLRGEHPEQEKANEEEKHQEMIQLLAS
ncbi:P27 family phage terminase small subunit [Pseudoruegeria sp. HB172150]|uniref:P27 family phage terminase small subunit n=1 Tax=Pseudoruegeria sp. HB172150 TaxID=2721164 RepID=UPI001557128D|nr:P27 family phage terminase small subunit [Pseudoruegeria sp. HB172150]